MRACEQMPGMNVLEHGASVHAYYQDLHDHIHKGTSLRFEWKIPEWIKEQALWEKTTSLEEAHLYHVYHDCGKPRCRSVDAEGRVHFPNHAAVSAQRWREIGGSEAVARLIGMDMDAHLLKDDCVAEFITRPEAATLLLTAMAEIHSNAAMFGGIDSTSFKMKWKQLDRRGKKITALLRG